jgi:hypothetical protein
VPRGDVFLRVPEREGQEQQPCGRRIVAALQVVVEHTDPEHRHRAPTLSLIPGRVAIARAR